MNLNAALVYIIDGDSHYWSIINQKQKRLFVASDILRVLNYFAKM